MVRAAALALLLCCVGMSLPQAAQADWPPAWRIVIGAPPDPNNRDFTSNGVLMPRGFADGYGYYNDYIHWAPSIVLPRPAMVLAPDLPDSAVVLRVHVPADAALWFSETPTTQPGELRTFVTPPLAEGRYEYAIRARWKENGKDVEQTRRVIVHPGDRLTVDFRAAELPAPQKLDN